MLEHLSDMVIRAEGRAFRELAKYGELMLLGRRASTRAPFPSRVMIEITNRCNLRCLWCARTSAKVGGRRLKDMDAERLLSLLPQLGGCRILLLHGVGEPLLYRDLEHVVARARTYVPTVCFTTNAVLLTRERSESLAAAGLSRIHVSINASDRDFVRAVTGTDLDAVLENVECFSRGTGLPVRLWTVVCRENIGHLHEMISLKRRIPTWDFHHFQLLQAPANDRSTRGEAYSGRISGSEIAALKGRIRQLWAEHGVRTDVGLLEAGCDGGRRDGICIAPWLASAFINVEGFMTPCCSLPDFELDNVFDIGFVPAWNGAIRNFRRAVLDGSYPSSCCSQCGYCAGETSPSGKPAGG